jgi:hypothetical protein
VDVKRMNSESYLNGWVCESHHAKLSLERQLTACDKYECCL